MLYPFQLLSDFIFPPTEHERRLRTVSVTRFTHWYRPQLRGAVWCLSEYQLPEVKAAISACKFEHSYRAGKLLSTFVTTYLNSLPHKKTILIPIPLSAKRAHKRGFNQVARVLQGVRPLPVGYAIETKLLLRTIDTVPQTSLTRADRMKNMGAAFLVPQKKQWVFDGIERIIICDDVMTTGATLQAAKSALIPHLDPAIEIICLAWTH